MNIFEDYSLLGFIGGLGTVEMLIFAGIMLLLFGSAKLPALMRNMGRSVNEFKAGIKEQPMPEAPPAVEEATEATK